MRVALVEKDRMVVDLVRQYLAEAGHAVLEVEPTLAAVIASKCDLIIMDLNLQAADGKRLFDIFRQDQRLVHLPCLLIAGRITMSDVQGSRKDPLSGFLVKPFTKAVFDDSLHRCLRQSLSKNCATPQVAAPQTSNSAAVIIRWRQDIDQILQYKQRVRAQLMIRPREIYEARLKEWTQKNPDQKPDTRGMKKAIMDLILLKSVVIVDHDEANQILLQDFARQQSILEIETFADAEEAWKHLQTKNPDFVVMDWSHDDAGGICLYNRLRSQGSTHAVPLVVLNKESDSNTLHALYEEDLNLSNLEKPVTQKNLQEVLVELMTRSLCAQKVQEALDEAFRQIVSINLLQDLVQDLSERLPDLKLHLVDRVHRLLKDNRFEEAERLARILVDKPDLAVAASTILARIYHMTKRTEAATDLLRYVCALAPQRLDRLLLAAETEFSLLHMDKARSYLQQARQIDGKDRKVEALTYVSEKIEQHGELQSTSVRNLISVLNTVGVTMARSGKPEEAVRYYNSALMIDADRLDRARLYYNLGLSYERAHDLDKAIMAHTEAEKLAAGEWPKVQTHLEALRKQMAKSA